VSLNEPIYYGGMVYRRKNYLEAFLSYMRIPMRLGMELLPHLRKQAEEVE